MDSYRDLVVWQAAMNFASNVYRVTARFPKSEVYGLTAQLRRCAVSIASNIAEGHTRGSTKEYQRFVSIAHGSLAEAETQLLLAERLEFAVGKDIASLLAQADEVSRMLRRLNQALQRKVA
ncbi:MAG: four helix bundle protein [Burkholderiales bacterium]|nr:four helix bundle protein [Burkholderiales bacterium]